MRLLNKFLLVAAISAASPVWAHDGHGHWHGPRHVGIDYRHYPDWRHRPHHAYGWRVPYAYAPYYGTRYYYPPYPPYGYAVAAPGIQVVVPNIYIPLR